MEKLNKSEIISRLRGQQTTDVIASCPVTHKKLIRKTLYRPSSIHAMELITPSLNMVDWFQIELNKVVLFAADNFSAVLQEWDKIVEPVKSNSGAIATHGDCHCKGTFHNETCPKRIN